MRRFQVVLWAAAAAVVLCAAARSGAQPVQWTVAEGGNGHIYDVVPGNWPAAEAAAVALGGHLASVNSAAEQDFLVRTFGPITSDNDPRSFWIGLSAPAGSTTFAWSSGEPVTYTNWRPGEPNNAGTLPDFTYIGRFAGGAWNDSNNTAETLRGVVEIVPEPAGLLILACGALPLMLRGRRSGPARYSV